jgi:hypothetical protein
MLGTKPGAQVRVVQQYGTVHFTAALLNIAEEQRTPGRRE